MAIVEELIEQEKVTTNNIKANNITIFDYLKDSMKIIIPRYQREYSWDKNNILMLINDFKKDYYIGNIIEYDNIEFMEKEIIDGQQRLITIFLILIVISQLTNNEEIKEEILELIKHDNICKLILKPRIGIDGSEILEYLIEGSSIAREIEEKYNEIEMYKFIKKELLNQDVDALYERIKFSNVVEISFVFNESSAHEMFVNVNTKGKPLEMIEILKSQLFKYLLNTQNTDQYKDKWQRMLERIPKNDYDTYCNDIYLLDYFGKNSSCEKYNTSGTVKENSMKLINSINSISRAQKIFDFMTGDELNNVFEVYSAVKNHKLKELKTNYYTETISRVSLGELDSIWNLYGEFRFKQSDIMFISLLFNKEQFILQDSGYLDVVMKYVFMYELYRSVMKISPANYSNSFKQASARIYNNHTNDEIKNTIKYFISTIKVEESDYLKLRDKLKSSDTFLDNKSRNGMFIIMMAEKFYTGNLTVEHFVSKKTNIEEDKIMIGKIGNLIPVSNDKYKNNDIKEKLRLYKLDKNSNKGIENFLNYELDEDNYKDKIDLRSNDIADKFINVMKEYYNRIMEG